MTELRILRLFTLKVIFLTFVTLLDLFSLAAAETCPSGLVCDVHEYCCGGECCSSDNYGYGYGYGFYNLWYFWFVIIMIMMTCCGACSYVKKRQYYMRQQQAIESMATAQPTPCPNSRQYPPNTYGVHPNMGPPVGTFPGPPAYNEVTEKPDQYPKAGFGYPNYGFAAPPYAPMDPNAVPQTSAAPPTATADPNVPFSPTDGASQLPYPSPASATNAATAYPSVDTPNVEPSVAPPPYTPSPQEVATSHASSNDQGAVNV